MCDLSSRERKYRKFMNKLQGVDYKGGICERISLGAMRACSFNCRKNKELCFIIAKKFGGFGKYYEYRKEIE